jgi:hypothetical protein
LAQPFDLRALTDGDLDECIDAGIGKSDVIDVQRQLVDFRRLQVRFERVDKNPVVI